ncbi:Hypothetical protein FKW44_001994, partial [Caligus rogercresseyi]
YEIRTNENVAHFKRFNEWNSRMNTYEVAAEVSLHIQSSPRSSRKILDSITSSVAS